MTTLISSPKWVGNRGSDSCFGFKLQTLMGRWAGENCRAPKNPGPSQRVRLLLTSSWVLPFRKLDLPVVQEDLVIWICVWVPLTFKYWKQTRIKKKHNDTTEAQLCTSVYIWSTRIRDIWSLFSALLKTFPVSWKLTGRWSWKELEIRDRGPGQRSKQDIRWVISFWGLL